MKFILAFCVTILSSTLFAQTNGQEFCSEFENDHYFPLDIEKKKLIWGNTYYFEEIVGTKTLNNREYVEYAQKWEAGNTESMFLREEDGVILQYEECCDEETIRFDPKFKEGTSWKSADKKSTYTIESFNGTLKTPFCNYTNLMVIKAKMTETTFKFYYKKGYGYIGATVDGNVMSAASPNW